MTDKPDENPSPDDGAVDDGPVDDEPAAVDDKPDLADEGDGIAEPSLIVEHDEEIELDDVPDVEPAYELQPGEDAALADPAVAYERGVLEDGSDDDLDADEVRAVPLEGESAADDAGDDGIDHEPLASDGDGASSHRGRRIVLGLVAVVGILYVGGYFLTGSRMPANATIGGVDVSGKSPSAAREAVDKALTPNVDREIVLTYGKTEFPIKPKAAGLAFDLDRSISQAGGERSWKPVDMVGLFLGHHETDPALDVDDGLLQSTIGTIGETVNLDVVEAQITFPKGKPTPREPKAGRVIARADAATAIRRAYLVSDEPIRVPTAVVEPAVDSDGLAQAMKTIAGPAVSAPIAIRAGDKLVSLPVTAYAPALVVQVKDSTLRPYLDPKKLAGPLTDSTTGIGKKAVDATVKIQGGKAVIVPGKDGVGLQPEEMAVKLLPALTEKGSARTVEVEAKVVEPEFTTQDAKALKITEKISSFETQFPYAEYRNINQGRAAELINGTILKPGETFSFNDVVGERTVANGFVTGTVINGGVFREELGGGVSQVATTTYNAGFFGGMDDVEHHPHAFYISRYPVGREATVYWGNLDLRFKNPTKYGVLVRSYVVNSSPSSPGVMHVELWSTKVWDVKAGQSARRNARTPGKQYDATDRCVPQEPIAGFDIDIYRSFHQGGKKVKTETDTARYQAADHVICGKKPKTD
jgi:vancomycin resistance protein YoaR